MKAIKSALLTLALLSTTALPAMANTVAVWNSQAAIGETNFVKSKQASVDASIKPKQQQLQTYQDTIKRLRQQLSDPASKLTDTQKQDLIKQLQTTMQNHDQVVAQVQTIIANGQSDLRKAIVPKMPAIRDSILKAKNIDILIDSSEGGISFVKPEWDVTKDFTQKLNEQVR